MSKPTDIFLKKTDQDYAKQFADLCDKSGVEMTPENCLLCIGFAKEAMRAGEVSVETYFAAKNLLIGRVELANDWVN